MKKGDLNSAESNWRRAQLGAGLEKGGPEIIKELKAQIQAAGQKKIEEAQILIKEKKYPSAVKILRPLSKWSKELPCQAEAKKILSEGDAIPAFRLAIRTEEAAENLVALRAENTVASEASDCPPDPKTPAKSPDRMKAERAKRLKRLDQFIKDYAETSVAADGKALLEKAFPDEMKRQALRQWVDDAIAEKLMTQAKLLKESDMPDEALKCYRRILETCPNSRHIPEVKKAIGEIQPSGTS